MCVHVVFVCVCGVCGGCMVMCEVCSSVCVFYWYDVMSTFLAVVLHLFFFFFCCSFVVWYWLLLVAALREAHSFF